MIRLGIMKEVSAIPPVYVITLGGASTWGYTGELSVGQLVSIVSSDTVEACDISSNSPGIGFVQEIISGTTCSVLSEGEIAKEGLTAGGLYYGGLAGEILLSTSLDLASLPKQPVGRARSSTLLKIQIGHPFFFTP